MKKTKLTKKWARENLKPVKKLIKHYKKDIRIFMNTCPLCEVNFDAKDGCPQCPWVVFTNNKCNISLNDDYFANKGDWLRIRILKDSSIKQRLFRLYGWKRRLQNIINK